ncbi:GAF domain-containing protein [Paenibacillus apiarius]|uniref:GAF domain-containing protein n=1 Tax=Paenibacillus apiarius TaxID=46240 RepID=A0ABT4DW64_9BACL|nr:GAF domain-containing protein [Paenibacillus apiarius]MCY9513782.1 GAF domain-containing protein [Paenibacillus apiarius]MCY9520518.1 GAF domain-containing protein [Paenibacillus apiarius]MCY9550651.1 GAF domain-containing protein [Paenibacillus apiarius]MCY9559172.1 GAF domain-containing protein [Paenibacillus apiarius]MCY9683033.1 GAF domain-containing protein [Paenibacillus apiarius]
MHDEPNFDYQQEIDILRKRFDFDFVSIALVQPAENQFVLTWQYASGNLNNRFKRIVLHSGKGIAGMVFKTGKPMLIKNVNTDLDPKDMFNYPIIVSEQLQSLGAVPLWKNSRVAGVLLVGFRCENQLTESLLRAFQQGIEPNFGPCLTREMVEQ